MFRDVRCEFLPAAVVSLFLACCLTPLHAQQAANTVEVRNRSELIQAVSEAKPGTTVLIAAGEYRGGLTFANLRGTKAKPIILRALDPAQRPVINGGASGIHLRNPENLELRDLIVHGATGNGINIDDGGDQSKPARNLVLHNLQVRDIGPKGNRDGIKLSGVEDFIVEDCSVERWGESGSAIDMVGCHRGTITHCDFRFRSDIYGNGVQTKGGSADITIQRCLFQNAGSRAINIGGSTGRDYFRPRDANYEARNIIVEDSTFVGSMSPIAFVGVDGATVRYNTIYRPTRWAVRILQESQGAEFLPCRNGLFSNNVIAYRSDEVRTIINIGGGTAPKTFRFAKNHWYCIDNPKHSRPLGLPTDEIGGSYGTPPMFRDVANGDYELSEQTVVKDAGVRPLADPE